MSPPSLVKCTWSPRTMPTPARLSRWAVQGPPVRASQSQKATPSAAAPRRWASRTGLRFGGGYQRARAGSFAATRWGYSANSCGVRGAQLKFRSWTPSSGMSGRVMLSSGAPMTRMDAAGASRFSRRIWARINCS